MTIDLRFLLTLLLLLPACAGTPGPPARAVAVPEVRGQDLSAALSVARSTGRNVLVEYADEDCRASRHMESSTLAEPEVKAKLESVVYVRLIKGETAAEFERRFGERGTPTFVVLRPDGTTPGSLVTGEIAVSDFLAYLSWARTAQGPEPELTKGPG
jgi:thiol:disulfide interchange protein